MAVRDASLAKARALGYAARTSLPLLEPPTRLREVRGGCRSDPRLGGADSRCRGRELQWCAGCARGGGPRVRMQRVREQAWQGYGVAARKSGSSATFRGVRRERLDQLRVLDETDRVTLVVQCRSTTACLPR